MIHKRGRSWFPVLLRIWQHRSQPGRGYKAFISYKHVASTTFAVRFESALKAYGKPLLAPPIRIFRDEKHLAPGADLPRLITDALDASEFLILLASPEAAGSPWVRDEVDRWCRVLGRSSNLIIVLIAGEITLDKDRKRIDWEQTDALPPILRNHLAYVPLYVDLRQVALVEDPSLVDPNFKRAVNAITARLRGIDPNDMLGEEVIQHRRNIRLRNGAVATLAALTLASMIAAYVAVEQRGVAVEQRGIAEQRRLEAERQRNEALRTQSRFLADLARQQTRSGDPVTGALLALHGLPLPHSTVPRPFAQEARAELQRAVWLQREVAVIGGAERAATQTEWGIDGQALLVFGSGGELHRRVTYDPRKGRWSTGIQEMEPAQPTRVLSSMYETSQRTIQTSPDGLKIIVPAKGAAQLRNAHTGELLLQFPTEKRNIRSLDFSKDGRRVLATYGNGISKIWSADSGNELRVVRPPDDEINHALFIPDGSMVVAALRSGAVRFFDATTGELWPKQPPKDAQHSSHAKLLRLDRGGRHLLSAGWDETVRILDLETFTLTSPPIQVGLRVQDAEFLSDGTRIVVGFSDGFNSRRAGGYAGIWNVRTGELERQLINHIDDVLTVDVSPDGNTIVTGSKDATAVLWDARTGEPLATLRGHKGDVTRSRFSPDGRWLVTISTDGTARIWEARDGLSVRRFGGDNRIIIGRSADLAHLVLAADDGSVFIQDTHTGAISKLPRASTELATAALFSPARPNLLIFSEVGGGELWDLTTSTKLRDLPKMADGILGADFSPNGVHVATAYSDGNVCLWRTHDGSSPRCHNIGDDTVKDVVFAPDGSKVLAFSTGPRPAILLLGDPIQQLQLGPDLPLDPQLGHRGTVETAAFSPDGRRAVTASIEGSAIIWEAATGKLLHVLAGHEQPINHAVFGKNGELVATASSDGTIRLWNAETGESIAVLGQPGERVWRLAFNPDGSNVASAGWDGSLRVWAVDTAELAGEYEAPSVSATDVAYSTDGRSLYVGYSFGLSALILPVFPDFASLRDIACERLPRTLLGTEQDRFFVGDSEMACSPTSSR